MKAKIIISLLIAFVLTFLSSCLKKGEDDPTISLRTRKARLVGKWKMNSGNVYSKSGSWITHEQTSVYTNDTYQRTNEGKGGGLPISNATVKNGSFSYTLEFKKDGGFISTQVMDNVTSTLNGTWNFTSGVGKQKNKEQIIINIESWTNTPNLLSYFYSGNNTNYTYSIKELRNKKLVLISNVSEARSDGYETIYKSDCTLEQ